MSHKQYRFDHTVDNCITAIHFLLAKKNVAWLYVKIVIYGAHNIICIGSGPLRKRKKIILYSEKQKSEFVLFGGL